MRYILDGNSKTLVSQGRVDKFKPCAGIHNSNNYSSVDMRFESGKAATRSEPWGVVAGCTKHTLLIKSTTVRLLFIKTYIAAQCIVRQ